MSRAGLWLALPAVAAALAAALAAAQTFRHMTDWPPPHFEIACGGPEGELRPHPRDTGCIDDAGRVSLETYAAFAIEDFRRQGFAHPYRFGPAVVGFEQALLNADDPYLAIRVFTDAATEAGAYVTYRGPTPESNDCGLARDWVVAVNPGCLDSVPDYLPAFVAAHELFHTIQIGDGESFRLMPHRLDECRKPRWIAEAKATAAAVDFVRRVFAETYPPHPDQRLARVLAGLRRYDLPLNQEIPGAPELGYYATSFWRLLLADAVQRAGMGDAHIDLSLGEVQVIPVPLGDGEYVGERFEELRTFGVYSAEPLREGVTGAFEAMILGHDHESGHVYLSPADEPARLTVHENGRDVLRAEVEGTVCEFEASEAAFRSGAPMRCLRQLQIKGSIAKPFAHLYRPAGWLVSRRTEGEDIYNRYWGGHLGWDTVVRAGLQSPGPGAPAPGGGGAGSGGSGASAGSGAAGAAGAPPCDCACPAETAARPACRASCAGQWAACPEPGAAPDGEPQTQTGPDAAADDAEQRAERVREAQIRLFTRLLEARDLAPQVREMLIEDFSGQSETTRRRLIRRYHAGDG
ncbi:MAG TPA: hypothetical protein VMM59_05440 [Thermohalobaculum sp.]|nr:hypothetical protein [Thermohalobaculum sp.]